MATTNYNLPTISDNMTADVVRDHNALASAVDTAVKTVENKADKIGNLPSLTTTNKTSAVDAINEVNAKTQIATQAEAQSGTNNTKVMTPLRVDEWSRFTTTSETNLNNITNSGRYSFTNFGLLTNTPAAVASGGYACYLEVKNRSTNDAPVQEMYFPSLNRKFFRTKNGTTSTATWLEWKEVTSDYKIATATEAQAGTNDTVLMTPLKTSQLIAEYGIRNEISVPQGITDLNLLNKTGFFRISDSFTNGALNGNGNLLSIRRNDVYATQIIFYDNGRTFQRIKNSSTWFSWREIGDTGNLSNLTTTDKTSLVAAINEVKNTANSKQDALPAEQKRNIYISATAPSNPSNNDIWIQI